MIRLHGSESGLSPCRGLRANSVRLQPRHAHGQVSGLLDLLTDPSRADDQYILDASGLSNGYSGVGHERIDVVPASHYDFLYLV